MENNGFVSVIIPVFNVRPYLVEALESVIHQTYNNLEIIIIDDGSTDGAGSICDEYAGKDPRIRVIHQENRGLSAARNVGLDLMRGDVIAFLDSDDAYLPEYVEKMMDALIRAEADIVVCKFTTHEFTGNLSQDRSIKILIPEIAEGRYDRVSILQAYAESRVNHAVWNKLYRRDLWREVRFPEGHVYEDREVIYRIFDKCKTVYVISDSLYLYRKRPGSIVNTMTPDNLRDLFLSISQPESHIEANIPEVFTKENLRRFRRSTFNQLIGVYVKFSRENGEANRALCDDLKARIIETGKRIGNSSLRVRACNWMIRYCPWMLRIAYPVYSTARRYQLMIFQK